GRRSKDGPRGLHGRRTDDWARGRGDPFISPNTFLNLSNSSSCSDDGARGRDGRRTDDRPHGRDDPLQQRRWGLRPGCPQERRRGPWPR
ncbi:unnamed protein product, partial [Larinioides sclopetarius]